MDIVKTLKEIDNSKSLSLHNKVIDAIENTDENALQLLVGIKIFEDLIEKLKESVMPLAIKELDKYGSKDVPLFGVIISKMEAGIRWDFAVCNDKVWESIKNEEEALAQKRKEREAVLKRFNADLFLHEIVNEDTAELVERPKSSPKRKSTTTISIEFPKPKKKRNNSKKTVTK